jgi:hypothetical protein
MGDTSDEEAARTGYERVRAAGLLRFVGDAWEDLPAIAQRTWIEKVPAVEAAPETWTKSEDPAVAAFARGVLEVTARRRGSGS